MCFFKNLQIHFYQYFGYHLKMERNTVFFLVNSIDDINNSISELKEIRLLTAYLKSYKQKWNHSFATGSYNMRKQSQMLYSCVCLAGMCSESISKTS